MSSTQVLASSREQIYSRLMAYSQGSANDDPLARMLATQAIGGGAMPRYLGLTAETFAQLMERHFPRARFPAPHPRVTRLWDPRLVEERPELVKLMLMYRAGHDESEVWMSAIVATGCMASDHLWHDLGLWSRQDVSALMMRNFPALAARNDRDMKWKKFLYKQLCIQEGIYICRAPSCEVCSDYSHCFGPEG